MLQSTVTLTGMTDERTPESLHVLYYSDDFSVSNQIAIKSAHINFLSSEPMQDQHIAEQGDRYETQHRCSDGSCSRVRTE